MSVTPAEMMKEYVNSQKFSSTTEVMVAMNEMFKDVLQQVMECELDNKLGYEKSERISDNDEIAVSKNYRNGYSQKTIKSQLGEVQVKIPRDRNGEYEPQAIYILQRQGYQISKTLD
jgi:putative transposase